MKISVNGDSTFIYTGSRDFDADLPSVVFIHGAGLDHSVWILQSRWFAHHGYNALALDLPGHGRSEGEVLVSIEALAEWTWQCLDTLQIQQAHLLGHSMGSLVALEMASRAPQRALLTALLGIAVPMAVSEQLLNAARDDLHAASNMITAWGHGFSAQLGGNQAPGMWMSGMAKQLLRRSQAGVLHNDLNACNAYSNGLQSAAKVSGPSVVLLGQQDIMASPRGAGALLDALPQCTSKIIAHCGHMMMAEQPDQVLDFLAGSVNQHNN